MNTKYTIKNFRVFDKEGVTVEIAPLSFLVGCNSSGKSSIVKSLCLLKSFFSNHIDEKHPAVGSVIDFSVKPSDSLGSFRSVVRTGSRDKAVTLQYDVFSKYINDTVTVSLRLEDGDLGNAVVRQVKISIKDGPVIITAGKEDEASGNFALIKEGFKQYLVATRYRSKRFALRSEYVAAFDISPRSRKQYEKEKSRLLQEAKEYCSEDYILNVYRDMSIESILDLQDYQDELNKYIHSGILTYCPVLDLLVGLTDKETVCSILKSRIKEKNRKKREAVNRAIDMVCDDFKASKYKDFLSYYKNKEDKELCTPFEVLRCSSILHNRSNVFDTLFYRRRSCIYELQESLIDLSSFEENVPYNLVHDLLAYLSDFEDRAYNDFEVHLHPFHYRVFSEFINKFIAEILNNDITDNLDYISSSRIQVRRMYPMEDRNEFSDAVRRYFETRKHFMSLNPPIRCVVYNGDSSASSMVEISDFIPGSFMNKWMKVFKIGDHMSLEMDKNNLGLLLKVYQTESDKKGILLADLGYGITQLFSILLQIEEMIMSGFYNKYSERSFSGEIHIHQKELDQPLSFKPRTVAIEEPEIHLHPRFQSLLAEMFVEAYKKYNIQFIVETHSEYLLRRIQTLVGSKALTPEEISMIYVEDNEEAKKGVEKVRRIPVKADGRLAAAFGPGFYDEADNLSLQLFTNIGS